MRVWSSAGGEGRRGWWSTFKTSEPSVISIAWSAARSRKVWVVWLVGQVTVSAATRRRVEQADRLDEAVAAEAAVVADRAVDRAGPAVGPAHVDPDPGPERRRGWSWCRRA